MSNSITKIINFGFPYCGSERLMTIIDQIPEFNFMTFFDYKKYIKDIEYMEGPNSDFFTNSFWLDNFGSDFGKAAYHYTWFYNGDKSIYFNNNLSNDANPYESTYFNYAENISNSSDFLTKCKHTKINVDNSTIYCYDDITLQRLVDFKNLHITNIIPYFIIRDPVEYLVNAWYNVTNGNIPFEDFIYTKLDNGDLIYLESAKFDKYIRKTQKIFNIYQSNYIMYNDIINIHETKDIESLYDITIQNNIHIVNENNVECDYSSKVTSEHRKLIYSLLRKTYCNLNKYYDIKFNAYEDFITKRFNYKKKFNSESKSYSDSEPTLTNYISESDTSIYRTISSLNDYSTDITSEYSIHKQCKSLSQPSNIISPPPCKPPSPHPCYTTTYANDCDHKKVFIDSHYNTTKVKRIYRGRK